MHAEEHFISEFKRLTNRHRDFIEQLCQRASYGQPVYCRELIQECYLELMEQMPGRKSDDSSGNERIWVYRRCRYAIKRYWRLAKHFPMLLPVDQLATNSQAPHEVSSLTIDDLAACLDGTEQKCFRLMADGTSDKEIERILQVKHHTLIQIRHEIKIKLKKYMEQ